MLPYVVPCTVQRVALCVDSIGWSRDRWRALLDEALQHKYRDTADGYRSGTRCMLLYILQQPGDGADTGTACWQAPMQSCPPGPVFTSSSLDRQTPCLALMAHPNDGPPKWNQTHCGSASRLVLMPWCVWHAGLFVSCLPRVYQILIADSSPLRSAQSPPTRGSSLSS